LKFGGIIARKLRRGPPRPDGRWHLDEVFVSINGRQLYVWRAVDSEGEVLDVLVQPRRDRQAALKLMRKLLKKQGVTPATIVTVDIAFVLFGCALLVPSYKVVTPKNTGK
jgi:putative transposase